MKARRGLVRCMVADPIRSSDMLIWSSYSTGTRQIDNEFGVGETVGTLGTSLLLFGFGRSGT